MNYLCVACYGGLVEIMVNCLSRLSHVCWANSISGISVRRMTDVARHAFLGIKKMVNINTSDGLNGNPYCYENLG